jgi:hypothetical protein
MKEREIHMTKLNNEVLELAIEELDAVIGGAKAEWGEVPCPVGHLTVVKLVGDNGQTVWGVSYHL